MWNLFQAKENHSPSVLVLSLLWDEDKASILGQGVPIKQKGETSWLSACVSAR